MITQHPIVPQINLPDNINLHAQPPSNNIRLPRIQIESFEGNYHKWVNFKNLYITLIHSKEMNEVEKLHHLLTYVSGEPKSMITHYQITAANYKKAWQTLLERYDNKRALVNNEIKILLNQPKIMWEGAAPIKALCDTTTECINSLGNLDIEIAT